VETPRRLKLTLAYDGRPFGGWQSQPNADTIQDRLEAAIAEVGKAAVRVHGSGRTDTGVHALAQIAHFDCPPAIGMNPCNWVPALNTKLPATIRVMDCEEVAPDFHARFSATAKTYTYDLCLAPVLPPLRAGLAWHLPRQLDPASLAEALARFSGTHDFRAFAANRGNETEATDYRRTVTTAALAASADGYRLTFTGNGFLYKMVRLLTGAAVQVAQGRLRVEALAGLLDEPADLPRGKSPFCAPADGLTLESVSY
jgi:tRNA pseudouridine38-40 synthase